MDVFNPGDHGSTFGGNPLAAAVGLAALRLLQEERLPERAQEMGAYLFDELRRIGHPSIREVRGKGLLIGMELDPVWISARAFCEGLMRNGILSKETHHTVVRFAPPLTITRQELDEALVVIRATFEELMPRAAKKTRTGQSLVA
jgi:ornithine--oxo-acid transaminase